MVRAWFMDDLSDDQRNEHFLEEVDLDLVKRETGVLYWKLDVEKCESDGSLNKIKNERGYTYQDVIEITPEKLPNYEEKIKTFFIEHLHTDEEIRFVVEGSGYFDVRNDNDKWIRIEVVKGDLIVLPAGIYHRFTLDHKNYIKAMRLFIGEPVWTPHNRPSDDLDCRKKYVEERKQIKV